MKRVIKASSSRDILGPYKEYYRVSTRRYDENAADVLSDYEVTFLGTAILDPAKVSKQDYNHLAGRGYEVLTIGKKDDTGEISLFDLSDSFKVTPVSIDDIKDTLDELNYEGYVQDVYY